MLCRDILPGIYRTYILARRVSFLYSSSSYLERQFVLSVSLTTCICFGGEVLYRGLYRVRKPELPHRSVASLCGKNYACNRRQECAIRKPTQRVQHAARSMQQGVLSQSSAGDKGPPLQAFTTFGFGASGEDLRGAATFCMGRTP